MKKITFKTILVGAFILLGMNNTMNAATIKVSSDAVEAGVNYNTIQAAYDYVKALPALTEKYVIELQTSYDPTLAPTLETFPITFAANTATADFDITIKPATGVKVTLANINSTSIFTNVNTLTTSAELTIPQTPTAQSTANVTAGMTVYGFGPFISSVAHPTVNTGGVTETTITCSRNMSTAQTGTTIYVGTPNTKTIIFNGAKYITIDGVSRDAASTTGLTIQNPNSIQASTVWIDGGSSYNTIKNCFIKGANVSGMARDNGGCGQIMFYNGHNDFNTITNNDICDIDGLPMPTCMVLLTYGGSSTNNDNTISENKIYNIGNGTSPNGNIQFIGFSSPNHANSFNNYILNNRIYWTKTAVFRSNPYIIGMGGGYNGLGNRIEGNVIGWQADGVTRAELTAPLNTSLTFYGANVKNCTFKNNVLGGINLAGKTFVGFQIGAHNATTSFIADDFCYGNQVKDVTVKSAVSGGSVFGIMLSAAPVFNVNVKNNMVKNITIESEIAAFPNSIQGIVTNFGSSTTIAIDFINNEVSNLTAGKAGSTAYNNITAFQSGGCSNIFEKNLIYNLNSITNGHAGGVSSTFSSGGASGQKVLYLADVTGMHIGDILTGTGVPANATITAINTTAVSVSSNLTAQASGTYTTVLTPFFIKGMRFATSKTDGVTIKNNIIRLGTDVTSDVEISAIINEGLSRNSDPFNIYHNTIYIGGTSQAKPSHCMSRAGAISGAITIKNNIFSNKRAGGPINQVYNLYANTDIATSENNLYQYGSKFATVTTTSPETFSLLSDYNLSRMTASLSEDNSKDQLDPLFTDATASTPDMHLPANSPANESGIAIATVTDDFVGAIRANYVTAETTNADMGALVISNSTVVETAKQLSEVSVYGIQNNIRFANLSGKNASVYSYSGQLLKSIKLASDNVAVQAVKGLYLVNINGEVTKVMVK